MVAEPLVECDRLWVFSATHGEQRVVPKQLGTARVAEMDGDGSCLQRHHRCKSVALPPNEASFSSQTRQPEVAPVEGATLEGPTAASGLAGSMVRVRHLESIRMVGQLMMDADFVGSWPLIGGSALGCGLDASIRRGFGREA